MEKITPFITSVWIDSLPHESNIHSEIISIQSYDTNQVQKSNRGGWQSNLYADGDHVFLSNLFENIKIKVQEVYNDLGIISKPVLKNYWFNCNTVDHFNLPHTHPYSFVSAVYYFKTPANSGNIVFRRPDNFSLYIENAHVDTPDNYRVFFVKSEENLLLMFPSYVEHYVEPSNSEELRMSLAINFG